MTVDVPTGKKTSKSARVAKGKQKQRWSRYHGDDSTNADHEDLGSSALSALKFTVKNVHTRSLTHIIQSVVSEHPFARDFHWYGFEEYWKPPGDRPSERVRTDVYNSDAFLEAEKTLLSSPPEPGCDLPRVILAIMIWSDATLLAQFGDAKLWPIYFLFANLTKYTRCRPNCHCAVHGAFVESVCL